MKRLFFPIYRYKTVPELSFEKFSYYSLFHDGLSIRETVKKISGIAVLKLTPRTFVKIAL
jgi:hypothetical protein